MEKKREKRSLMEMHGDAQEYAKKVFSRTNFHIPEGSMEMQAPAIILALYEAWAAGYAAKCEEKSR